MPEYRDERLVKELEKEIEENECGVSDCLWFFCCGIFGLVCIVPKYNKRKFANDRLLLELAKPKKPRQPVQKQAPVDPAIQQQPEPQSSLTPSPPSYEKKG